MPNFRLEQKQVMAWVARDERARKYREVHRNTAKSNFLLFEGDSNEWRMLMPGGVSANADAFTYIVNLIYTYVMSDARKLCFSNPKWCCDPLMPTFQAPWSGGGLTDIPSAPSAARLAQFANFLTHQMKMVEAGFKAYVESHLTNESFWKLGYRGTGDVSHTALWPDPEEGEKAKIERGFALDERVEGWFPHILTPPGTAIVCDPDAREWPQVNWIRERILRPRIDVENDPMYSDNKGLKSNLTMEAQQELFLHTPHSDQQYADDYMELLEFHYRVWRPDIQRYRRYLLTIAPSNGMDGRTNRVIRHEPYPVDVGGWYYERLQLNNVPNSLLGFPLVNLYKRLNGLFNYWFTYQQEWMARVLPKYIVPQEWTDEQVKRLESGIMHGTIRATGDLQNTVVPIQMQVPPPETQMIIGLTRQALDQVSGRSALQGLQPTGTSATEVTAIANEAADQIENSASVLAKFYENAMKKCIRLAQAQMPEGGLKIPGSDGAQIHVEPLDMSCPALFKMDVTSQARKAAPVERKLAIEDLMTFMKIPPRALPEGQLNLKLLVEDVLAKGGRTDTERFFVKMGPKPWDPEIEHRTMLEGGVVQPNPQEPFAETIAAHRQFAMGLKQDPARSAAWFRPYPPESPAAQKGLKTPAAQIAQHVIDSEAAAVSVGQGRAAGVGMANAPGSAPDSGRPGQGVPNEGNIAASAGAVQVPGGGNGNGIQ